MLTIKKEFLEKIILHAKKELPNECCGILAGKNGTVKKVYDMKNIEKTPLRFFAEPKQQFVVMKQIWKQGLDMVGIYHSHPDIDAYPSAHDVRTAFYPDVLYVIASLKNTQPIVRAFRIVDSKITEEKIEIAG